VTLAFIVASVFLLAAPAVVALARYARGDARLRRRGELAHRRACWASHYEALARQVAKRGAQRERGGEFSAGGATVSLSHVYARQARHIRSGWRKCPPGKP